MPYGWSLCLCGSELLYHCTVSACLQLSAFWRWGFFKPHPPRTKWVCVVGKRHMHLRLLNRSGPPCRGPSSFITGTVPCPYRLNVTHDGKDVERKKGGCHDAGSCVPKRRSGPARCLENGVFKKKCHGRFATTQDSLPSSLRGEEKKNPTHDDRTRRLAHRVKDLAQGRYQILCRFLLHVGSSCRRPAFSRPRK